MESTSSSAPSDSAPERPNWVPAIQSLVWSKLVQTKSHVVTHVFVALAQHADRKTGLCWPSRSRIARLVGCSERSVSVAYRELERLELVERVEQGKGKRSNRFIVRGLGFPEPQHD